MFKYKVSPRFSRVKKIMNMFKKWIQGAEEGRLGLRGPEKAGRVFFYPTHAQRTRMNGAHGIHWAPGLAAVIRGGAGRGTRPGSSGDGGFREEQR